MFDWSPKAQNAIFLDENTGGKGRYFKAKFLQPGLVKYSFGVCILDKEIIDKFVSDFVGCPVIIDHQDVTSENAKDVCCGNIAHVWYDDKDGFYWCDGIITDETAISLINDGYNVSCQYEITEYANNTTNKLHNGNPYDKVILNGKPEHLAIVKNPRYENALIAVNAIEFAEKTQNDNWITVKPNGKENKGRHLLIKDGESVEDAMHRQGWYAKRQATDNKDNKKFIDKKGVKYSLKDLIKKGFNPVKYSSSLWSNKPSYSLGKDNLEFPLSEKEYKEALEHRKTKQEKDLQEAKTSAKGIIDFVKYQTNADIEPFITRKTKDKIIVDWEKLPREGKAALKMLARDGRFKLEEYSAWEMAIEPTRDDLKSKNSCELSNFIKENKMFIQKLLGRNTQEMNKDDVKNVVLEVLQGLKAANEADEKDKEADNGDVDKRELIRQIMAIAGKHEDNEDVRTIAKLAEKLAYDKSEAGTADNKAKNADGIEDKRKLIDEVGGILKDKVDEELWRTIIGKIEKIAYSKSEAGTADNKCKNEDEEAEKKYKELKEKIEKEAENKKAKNSIEKQEALIGSALFKQEPKINYVSQKDRLALGDKLF